MINNRWTLQEFLCFKKLFKVSSSSRKQVGQVSAGLHVHQLVYKDISWFTGTLSGLQDICPHGAALNLDHVITSDQQIKQSDDKSSTCEVT